MSERGRKREREENRGWKAGKEGRKRGRKSGKNEMGEKYLSEIVFQLFLQPIFITYLGPGIMLVLGIHW